MNLSSKIFFFLLITVSFSNCKLPDFKKAKEEVNPTTYVLPADVAALLKQSTIDNSVVVEVRNSKVRRSISRLLIDKKYDLFIYNIDDAGGLSLDSIQFIKESNHVTTRVVYEIIGSKLYYQFQYAAGIPPQYKKLQVACGGNLIKEIMRSDSLINYSISCKNLSLRENDASTIDIYMNAEHGMYDYTINLNIIFKKVSGKVYLFILTDNDREKKIPDELLMSLLS